MDNEGRGNYLGSCSWCIIPASRFEFEIKIQKRHDVVGRGGSWWVGCWLRWLVGDVDRYIPIIKSIPSSLLKNT